MLAAVAAAQHKQRETNVKIVKIQIRRVERRKCEQLTQEQHTVTRQKP